ncbi:MAG: sugar phosphate isomerase/epimerase family protein [Bryobacteraceae bacterium]
MTLSRRAFVKGAAALLPATSILADPLEKNNLGVQLYTVREIIKNNPLQVLESIRKIGYREVEAIYATLPITWSAIQQAHLKAVSVHGSEADFEQTANLKRLKQRGFSYIVRPGLPINQGAAVIKRVAKTMNQLGKQARSEGLTLCYHTHAQAFKPINGTPAVDILMNETHKEYLQLELDVFWVSVAGHNPADVLKKFSGRVPLIHLKDKARGIPAQYNQHVPPTAFKAVGSGVIDFPAVLKAADSAGVKHYIVEQDQTPGNQPIKALRKSYHYLKEHFGA